MSDPLDIIFSPSQVARAGTTYIEQRAQNKNEGIPFYLPAIDNKFLPLLPGELCTIIGRPGSGKSALQMYWARSRAKYLQSNFIPDRVVVFVTYEQHVEELYAFHVAAEIGVPVDVMARGHLSVEQIEQVKDYGIRRANVPLWFMGHSQERRKKRPVMKLENVQEALFRLQDWEVKNQRDLIIDMIFFDYLQRIPFDTKPESKVIGIDENLNKLKDIGLMFACPVVAGVQARREVDDYPVQVPELNDGQWCSGVEQISDKMFSVVRPIKYVEEGKLFGKMVVQGRNQMCIVLLKQKLGDAPFVFWTLFDPQYNSMCEAETKHYDLNKMMGEDE